MPDDQALIALESSDGESIPCRILDIFEFLDHEYALLIKVADESLVIMRMCVKDGATVFQTIETDEEFDQVLEYIRMLAKS